MEGGWYSGYDSLPVNAYDPRFPRGAERISRKKKKRLARAGRWPLLVISGVDRAAGTITISGLRALPE